jgi:D-3-phosphoglycerate dehydrogenase
MKVVIIGKFSEGSKQLIRNVFPVDWKIVTGTLEELDGEFGDADVVLPEHVKVDGSFLECAKQLKLVQTGAGFDSVDIEACTARGVHVANAAGVNEIAVAEHVMTFILCWYKNMIYLDAAMKKGQYGVDYTGAELAGKVIGIIGLGKIGLRVTHLARAFNMKVLGYDIRTIDPIHGVVMADLPTLLRESDVVTLHVFLNDKTKHLIDHKELDLMKTGAFLINTARGSIINEAVLIEALQSRKIGGAGLDVFEIEPLSQNSPLRKLDNVILSPHTAGMPDGLKFHQKRYEFFRKNILLVAEGKAPINALNRIE